MTIGVRNADYLPRNINNYVPRMGMAANIVNGQGRISFGTPNTTDPDGISTALAADDSGPYTYTPSDFAGSVAAIIDTTTGELLDCPFGRVVTFTGSAAGVTQNVTLNGRDMYGQPITKTLAMTGTTALPIPAAVKYITSVVMAVGASAETFTIGINTSLGLPFKSVRVISEELDGVPQGTLGTLTAPVLTDPATVTTGDPRGTYVPNATMTGSAEVTALFIWDDWVNGSNNGGLMGIQHFAS